MSHQPRKHRSPPDGFTLLEMMIVVALLALLMAVVWPSLRRPLQRSATQQAARQLTEDLGRARLNAIESGRTMAVRFQPGGARYVIAPADAVSDGEVGSELSSGDSFSGDADVRGEAESELPALQLVIEGTLDNDVVFRDPAAVDALGIPLDSTLGDMLADEMAETEAVEPLIQDGTEDTRWSAPVLIYPTGRAENGTFVLVGPAGYRLTVTLRGLTGAVRIGPLERDAGSVGQNSEADLSRPTGADDEVEFGSGSGGFE